MISSCFHNGFNHSHAWTWQMNDGNFVFFYLSNPLFWDEFMDKCQQWCICFRSLYIAGRTHIINLSQTISTHDFQMPLRSQFKLSFYKGNLPCLLRKSNHPKPWFEFWVSAYHSLALFPPYSPFPSSIPPFKPLSILSSYSCRKTGDPVGELGHLVNIL